MYNKTIVEIERISVLMIKVAVVGAGYWGPNIIRNFNQNPDCLLMAVCDTDQDRLDQLENTFQHPVVLTQDYQRILNEPEVDAVAVVTGIDSHEVLIEAALKAGKHVFVEKPLAESPKACLRLGQLAQEQNKILFVGHTFIYNPAVQQLKTIYDSGELGDIYYLHAQRLNLGRVQTTTNALWSLAVHDISIVLHLFDELPIRVRSWGNAFITPDAQDVVFANLEFPSGKLANIHVSWLDPEKKRQVTLVGSQKMVVYDDVSLDRKITVYDKGIDKPLTDNKGPEYKDFSGFQLLTRSGDVHIPHLKFTEPLKLEVAHFIDCVKNNKKPLTSWQEGYQVVNVLASAQESLTHGGIPVDISWSKGQVKSNV